MYPGVDLRLQRYAVAVAEELSFSKAAKRLHVAQPALSRSIRQLEDFLGIELFERTSRRVILTDAGQRFVTEARKALYHSDRAVEMAKVEVLPDKIAIGYPAHFDVRHVIQLSRVSVPGVRIQQFSYHSSSTLEILARLHNRTLDCCVVALPNEYREVLDYTTVRLSRYHLGIAVLKTHPLARKRSLGLSDLKDQPLIFVAREQDPVLHTWFERHCRAAGFAPRIVQEIRHPHDYAALVAHGAGIGVGFGFSRTCSLGKLSSNLALRVFNDPQLSVETAVIFGNKFKFTPLNVYVTAVEKIRRKYPQHDRQLPLSA